MPSKTQQKLNKKALRIASRMRSRIQQRTLRESFAKIQVSKKPEEKPEEPKPDCARKLDFSDEKPRCSAKYGDGSACAYLAKTKDGLCNYHDRVGKLDILDDSCSVETDEQAQDDESVIDLVSEDEDDDDNSFIASEGTASTYEDELMDLTGE